MEETSKEASWNSLLSMLSANSKGQLRNKEKPSDINNIKEDVISTLKISQTTGLSKILPIFSDIMEKLKKSDLEKELETNMPLFASKNQMMLQMQKLIFITKQWTEILSRLIIMKWRKKDKLTSLQLTKLTGKNIPLKTKED